MAATSANSTPIKKEQKCENCKLQEMQLKNLQESYHFKSKEYAQLLENYRNTVVRFKEIIESIETLVKSFEISINLLISNVKEKPQIILP